MKQVVLMSVVFAFLSAFCLAQEAKMTVKVENPVNVNRQGATIEVPWKDFSSVFPEGTKSIVVSEQNSGEVLPSQEFDANLDGVPDEVIFQSDFKPMESKVFSLAASSTAQKMTQSLVDVQYVLPRQDVAWENDRIAFRVYGPALAAEVSNGIDVWTKRVRYLIIKKWYEGEEQTPKIIYHIDHGEGADFFDVNRSLGCGGAGIWQNGKVYQPGVFSRYRIISMGPLRACFEVYYDNWDVNGMKFKETERITLDAGQNLNKIDVTFAGEQPGVRIELACGLVQRNHTRPYKNDSNTWVSLWGQINDNLPNGYLGTGIVFKPGQVTGTTEDSSQYIAFARTSTGSTFSYYAGAGWTRSGDFRSVDDWNGYLKHKALEIESPLSVTVVK